MAEEEELIRYTEKWMRLDYPSKYLSTREDKLDEMIQNKLIYFTNEIPRRSCLKWFIHRRP